MYYYQLNATNCFNFSCGEPEMTSIAYFQYLNINLNRDI